MLITLELESWTFKVHGGEVGKEGDGWKAKISKAQAKSRGRTVPGALQALKELS